MLLRVHLVFLLLHVLLVFMRRVKSKKKERAVCYLDGYGHVLFMDDGLKTRMECHLENLPTGMHGVHVHTFGDLRSGCHSGCNHYNPYNEEHGGRTGAKRHRGDMGNVYAGKDGVCEDVYEVDVSVSEIIGRMLVVHEGEDDLGRGNVKSSKVSGNSGGRLTCGVIGYAK